MDADRWHLVSRLYHEALARPADEWDAFLDSCCQGDQAVRDEVASLLARQTGAEDFLALPTADILEPALIQSSEIPANALEAGVMLGAYRVERSLGRGGIGAVFLAHDTTLHRQVALKVLDSATNGETARVQLLREARNAAALNHPNICTVYEVGEANNRAFIAMEYVEGESLSDRLARGPLPLQEVLRYGIQAADAMTYAHCHDVIHRDFKAANAILTLAGRLKIVDFGLAHRGDPMLASATTMPTLVPSGAAAGTPYAMAPEQIRGEPTDARTDIWALGVLLHEMSCGAKPFHASSIPDLFSSILRDAPLSLPSSVPMALKAVIGRCLEKDPVRRYQRADDVEEELDAIQRNAGSRVAEWWSQLTHHRWLVSGTAALGLVVALVAFDVGGARDRLVGRANTAPLTDKDVVVLADFRNSTADSVFDLTLREAVAAQLEESPFLKILSDDQMREGLRLMGRNLQTPITSDIAREICQRAGQKATIGGSIASLGRLYVLALQATDCRSGETLGRAQAEAEDKEHVLKAVGEVATELRGRLGESLSSIQSVERRDNVEVTTPSLEAFRAYALGREQDNQTAWLSAITFYDRALRLDPSFAMAYLLRGQKYWNLQEVSRRDEDFKKAFALVDHVTERERLLISGLYYNQVTHDEDKAAETWQTHIRLYPREASPHNYLGIYRSQKGEYAKAAEEFQEAIRLDPRDVVFRGNLMAALVGLNQYTEAKAAAAKAFAEQVDGLTIHRRLLHLAQVLGDRTAAQKEIARFAGTPQEFQSLNLQGEDASAHGRRREALEFTRHAVEAVRRQNLPDTAAVLLASSAQIEAAIGNCDAALAQARTLVPRDPEPDSAWRVADTLAVCGDIARAQKLVDDVSIRFPRSTVWSETIVPFIRAAMELSRDQPSKVLDVLPPPVWNPVSMYRRGLALLRLRRGREAAAAFQFVIDQKGVYWGGAGPGGVYSLLFAPAYVGAARAETLAGDVTKAKTMYQDFFELWKDADADIPLLVQARKEYAAL